MFDAARRIDPAIDARTRLLIEALDALQSVPDAQRLRDELQAALARAQNADAERPICIALLGGTGVGKSTLFNALIGRPEASPTSDAERGFTRVPHVATHPADRSWLSGLANLDPVHLDAERPGFILIDSPDIDSVDHANRTCARRVIAEADLVVYVASPDKRANFDISEEVRAWGLRKRWFFVLTRADTLADSRDDVRNDFLRRLVELGFPATDETLFLVDAAAPARSGEAETTDGASGLDRLRETLLASRTIEERRALREDAGLREVGYALRPDGPMQALRLTAEHGRVALCRIHDDLRAAYAKHLLSPRRLFLMEAVWRHRIWSLLAYRVRGPVALAVHMRARLAGMALAVDASRLEQHGAIRTGYRRLRALFGAPDPGQTVLVRPDARERRPMNAAEQDARRVAEDMALNAGPSGARDVGETPDAAIVDEVDAALTERAAGEISRCVRRLHVWMGNLLPFAVLFWDLRRLALAWSEGNWLPAAFYGSAAAVFAAALLPGYLLISAAVARLARDTGTAVREALEAIRNFTESAPLARALQRVEDAVEKADALGRAVEQARTSLSPELDRGRVGDEIRSATDSRPDGRAAAP